MIDVIEDFASRQLGGGVLTVTRTGVPAVPYDADGYPAATTTSTLTIIAQVVPTSGRALQILADQGITSDTRTLRTASRVFSRDDNHAPDLIAGVDLDDDGITWAVINWKLHTAPDGDRFYEVIVARGALK
jgi:hypothetical protein